MLLPFSLTMNYHTESLKFILLVRKILLYDWNDPLRLLFDQRHSAVLSCFLKYGLILKKLKTIMSELEEKWTKLHHTFTKWIWFPSISGACGPSDAIFPLVSWYTCVPDSITQFLCLITPRRLPAGQKSILWTDTCNLCKERKTG